MDWKHPFGRACGGRRVPAGSPEADILPVGPVDAPGDHGNVLQPHGESWSNAPAAGPGLQLWPHGVDAGGPAADVADEPSGGLDFTRWVQRPDASDRMGWEAPELPEAGGWWARGAFDDLREPDWSCASCGSLVWWEDGAGTRHCLDCERAGWERAEELAGLAHRLRGASGLSPWGTNPGPGECPRCRSTEVRDVPIHGGLSVRRDCARCGQFIAFVTWYGRVLHPSGN